LNYNKWLSFPQKLQIEIINTRYIGVHDGNECSLVAEDNDHYYYAIACCTRVLIFGGKLKSKRNIFKIPNDVNHIILFICSDYI